MFDRLQNTLRENCPIRSFSAPYFPALGLNTERYHDVKRVRIRSYLVRIFPGFSRIRTEYGDIFSPNEGKSGKNADQNNSEYGLFLRCEMH